MGALPEKREGNVQKLVALCEDEFKLAAASGQCGPMLWSTCMLLRTLLRSDVQVPRQRGLGNLTT